MRVKDFDHIDDIVQHLDRQIDKALNEVAPKCKKIVEVDFLWNRTVDLLKTSFHPLLWTSSGLKGQLKTTPYMGNDKLTDHAQNLKECKKCIPRKAVGNLELSYGCEITVIVQEGLKRCYTSMLYKLNKVTVQGLKHVY